jgi:hypothetical protein
VIWIAKNPEGGWRVWILATEMGDLLRLPARLREVLEKPDFTSKVVERLFPRAFPDDPQAEADYQGLLRDDLFRQKLENVAAFEKCLVSRKEFKLPPAVIAQLELGEEDARLVQLELAEEDLSRWLGTFHDLRLLIGTKLDLTDESWEQEIDPRDPDAPELQLLHRLAYFEEMIIQALREAERLL